MLSLIDVKNEIVAICKSLDEYPQSRNDLTSRAFHLTDAIENADPEMWAEIDWNGFLRALTGTGMALDILGAGRCVAWAAEAGLLESSFCFERQKDSPYEQVAWRVPRVAIATLADSKSWGGWIEPGIENLGFDDGRLKPKFAQWLATLEVKGFEAPKLVAPVAGWSMSARGGAWAGVADALDKAESEGLLEFFKRTGRLEPWAAMCMVLANEERFDRALCAGADFSKLTAKQSWQVFVKLAQAAGPGSAQWSSTYGRGKKSQKLAAFAWDADLKQRLWKMAIGAGMPLALCGKEQAGSDGGGGRPWNGSGSGPLARMEMERGGLRGKLAMSWLIGESLGGMSLEAFDGEHPVVWGLARGLSVEDFEKGALMDAALRSGQGDQSISALLIGLAKAKAKLTGSERGIYSNDSESLLGRLLHIGASEDAARAAVEIGIDWRARNASGDPILNQLFELERAGGYQERLAGLISGVGAAGKAELLAQRGKDGSGPMHWAARALCPGSIKRLHAEGEDPNGKDSKGASAGHWAAKKYGAKRESKVGPTIQALSKAGQNWKQLDGKGVSALAALAAKAPLEPLASLLESQPEALKAKGEGAKDALEALQSRPSAHAKSLAQKVDIQADLAEASKSRQEPKKAKGARL